MTDTSINLLREEDWRVLQQDGVLRLGGVTNGHEVKFEVIEAAFANAFRDDFSQNQATASRTPHEDRNFERALEFLAKAGINERDGIADQITRILGAKELTWLSVEPGPKDISESVSHAQFVYLVTKDGAHVPQLPLSALQSGVSTVDARISEVPKELRGPFV